MKPRRTSVYRSHRECRDMAAVVMDRSPRNEAARLLRIAAGRRLTVQHKRVPWVYYSDARIAVREAAEHRGVAGKVLP